MAKGNHEKFITRVASAPTYRRVEQTNDDAGVAQGRHSMHSCRVGEVRGNVEVWIDLDAIIRALGVKALRSRSGKSVGLSGAVRVVAVRGSIRKLANYEHRTITWRSDRGDGWRASCPCGWYSIKLRDNENAAQDDASEHERDFTTDTRVES